MKKIFSILTALLCFSLYAEEINFSADSMSGTAGSKTDTTTLSGSAWVKTSTMEIKADSIELSGDDFRFITAEGAVTGSNTESQLDFTCGKMKYDRKTKIAQLEDSVHLVDTANDVSADAQLIEYNQNNETAIMQIGITLKQKDNTCTSSYAIYRKQAQMLEMSGNPKIIQGKDSFRAQEITLNLENQEITLDGRVRGTVTDSKPEPENKDAPESDLPKKDEAPAGEIEPPQPEPEQKETDQESAATEDTASAEENKE